MTAGKPPWGTSRESVTVWLGKYGAVKFTATGTVRDSRKYPKLAAGDAVAIAAAAGLSEDEGLEDAAIAADDAVSTHQDNLDGGASGEDRRESREWRDDCVAEFIGELRKRLLPEAVAAEEAELDRLYPRTDDPLPGLQGAT